MSAPAVTVAWAGGSIPPLDRFSGSWIIVSRATGEAVFETFERTTAERVNQNAYEVVTAIVWLARLNRLIRAAGGVQPSPEAMVASASKIAGEPS